MPGLKKILSKNYQPQEVELSPEDIVKLAALSRAKLLIIDGISQRIFADSGRYYIAPEPCYLWDCAEFISKGKLKEILENL